MSVAEYLLSELQHLILSFRAVPRELGENMLWTTCAILVILWLLGWGLHLAGTAVHLLLVLALIIFILDLVTGHRTVFVRTGEGLRPLARLARLLQVPKEKQSELRKFPRFPAQLSLAVTVNRAGKFAMLQGVSTDLGEGGIGGIVDGDLEPGEYVLLIISDSRLETQLRPRAQVRYRKDKNYGFAFFDVSPMEQADVRQVCGKLMSG